MMENENAAPARERPKKKKQMKSQEKSLKRMM